MNLSGLHWTVLLSGQQQDRGGYRQVGVSGRVSAGNTHTGQCEESLIKGCVTEMWAVLEQMNPWR